MANEAVTLEASSHKQRLLSNNNVENENNQNTNESDLYTSEAISVFLKSVRATQEEKYSKGETSEEKVQRLCSEIKTLETAYKYMTAETIDDMLEVYKSSVADNEAKESPTNENENISIDESLSDDLECETNIDEADVTRECDSNAEGNHVPSAPKDQSHKYEISQDSKKIANFMNADGLEIVTGSFEYVEISSVIYGKYDLPSMLNMEYGPPGNKDKKNAREDKKLKNFQLDPRLFSNVKTSSKKYAAIENYLQTSKSRFDFGNGTTANGKQILSKKDAVHDIISFLECVQETSDSNIIELQFKEKSCLDVFLFIFQGFLEEQAQLKKLVKIKCSKRNFNVDEHTFEHDFQTKFLFSNKISSRSNVMFLDINFIEYESGSNFDEAASMVELTNLGAYSCKLYDEDLWQKSGIRFKQTIAPNWLLKQVSHFSKVSEMEYIKKHKLVWQRSKYNDRKELHSVNSGAKCVDEKTAIRKFCEYLEAVTTSPKCKDVIIVVFSSPYVYLDEYDTILPLRILLSKIHEYRMEDIFYKYIVGYADLVSNKARKDFGTFFKMGRNMDDYTQRKRDQANKIIKECEQVMENGWPSGKTGTQALGGIMSLIGNIESKKIYSSLSLTGSQLKIDSKYLYRSAVNISERASDFICRVKCCNFPNFDNGAFKINLVKALSFDERYHHKYLRQDKNRSPNISVDKSNNEPNNATYLKKINERRSPSIEQSSSISKHDNHKSRKVSEIFCPSKDRQNISSNNKEMHDLYYQTSIKSRKSNSISPTKRRSQSRDRLNSESKRVKNYSKVGQYYPFSNVDDDRLLNIVGQKKTFIMDATNVEHPANESFDLRSKIISNVQPALDKMIDLMTDGSERRIGLDFKVTNLTNSSLDRSPLAQMEVEDGELLDD